ncbi:MAG: diaminopimelate epimerase [Planctomycetes bacterium]|nr:diaminopimelate epimerase [Planctomycetota bacterium]
MHGLGNDYVYLDERELEQLDLSVGDPSRWSRVLSDRHRGVGSDGLIIVRRDPEHPCRMEMFNADGSRAEMCGNGIRCVARLARERGYAETDRFTIATDAGALSVAVDLASTPPKVRVGMGRAIVEEERAVVEVDVGGGRTAFEGTVLSLGNPHFVVPLSSNPADFPVEEFGPALEHHSRFPNRANIEFVRATDRHDVEFRVWERGSGQTQACGTGAAAAAVALRRLGMIDTRCTVHLLGGDLEIEVDDASLACWKTGPAELSFVGEFPLSLVESNDT